ncbi:MAG: protein-disulfide reductase DsbD family protein [Cryomorphaceae bacterium]
MKVRLLVIIALIFTATQAFSQIYNPVKWNFEHTLDGDEHAILKFSATIEDGWHVYATKLESDLGPIATEVVFDEVVGAELVGELHEPKPHTEFDPIFDMELSWFDKSVTLSQRVKLTAPMATVTGELTYMTCDDSKCLPPEYLDFRFDIEAALRPSATNSAQKTAPSSVEVSNASAAATAEASTSVEPISSDGKENEIFQPVSWAFTSAEKENGVVTIIATATIDEHWHVYSKDLPNEDGPIATEFNMLSGDYKKIGAVREIGELVSEYDPNFMMDLNYYSDKMVMEQDIEITGNTPIEGEIYFMTCDEQRCLPPEAAPFTYDPVAGMIVSGGEETEGAIATVERLTSLKIGSIDLENPANDCGEEQESGTEEKGFLSIFLLGFLGGLVALLTPCVFPMIPLTVSFFTKGSENKAKGLMNAFLYGLSIFLIYVILSLPFHFLDSLDPEILNTISTNVWLNVGFFVIFVVFAISFFGYFELTLPSGVANKVDSASSIGGLLGIFFMALTLAIVSFSCTGPILGSLLAGSLTSSGGAMQLTMGMGGFGLALALPFGLFAAFPGWLNSLPRSGSWLTNVKVVLGFVELALAVKFLSNADLVEHWGLLKREIFFGLWILIGSGLALYLLGYIKFPHDNPNESIGMGRKGLAAVVIAFVLYLIPGLTNTSYANLQLLSGFPPPLFYSIYEKDSNCPLEINCFKDYEEGLAYAKANNKPIMIDFTGWACVNCRRMEENVWVKPDIYDRLNDDYVLISLYVDDRKELPESEQFEYTTEDGRKKKIKTVGNKWATLQSETFRNNSQPYYVLMNHDESLLTLPVGYTPDVEEYKDFLDCGLDAFNAMEK